MGWGESIKPKEEFEHIITSRSDVRPADAEHASIAPLYMTVEPSNANARYVVCSFQNRSDKWFVELFLVDKTKDIDKELELISAVAGGGLFNNLTFLYVLGEQP